MANIYMDQQQMRDYAVDVAGSDPYYMMQRKGPAEYQFPGQPDTDAQAYDMNMQAMLKNAVPGRFAEGMWMRMTPQGMIYTTGDKLFAGSDFTDMDLYQRETRLREMGWQPVIAGGE